MSDLNPCRKCGSQAAEHIRGEFHAITRDDVPENHTRGNALVSMDKSIEEDYRIACSQVKESDFVPTTAGGWVTIPGKCDNFLPWSFSTLREVAKTKAKWNEMNPVKVN